MSEVVRGSTNLAQMFQSHFDDPLVYQTRYTSRENYTGEGFGDCFANTQRLIQIVQREGLDLSKIEAVVMWYSSSSRHQLVVEPDMLRLEEKGIHDVVQWAEHSFLIDRRDGANPLVYDLSASENNSGIGLKKYFEMLFFSELKYRHEQTISNVQLINIPAADFVTLTKPSKRALGQRFGQKSLGQVLNKG